jgi:transcriptional regulator GlxA family with amidase domain
MSEHRRVVIVAFPGVQTLDVIGPAEVFSAAGSIAGKPYELVVAAPDPGPVAASSGVMLHAERSLRSIRGRIDTLIVAGGWGTEAARNDKSMIAAIQSLAGRSRRVTSVCSGSFLLAAAGLLDGCRATTHWASLDLLERRHPALTVDRDSIFVRDGDVWTSAGVTAGMDLALALVEEDLGRAIALETARWLVLYVQRPGGQAQFSAQLAAQLAEHEPVRAAQAWVVEHPEEDLSVEALASRANMSTRNFARVFRREVGMTPAAYVETVRVERAQRELETTRASVDSIAHSCGFGTPETMRRAFRRRVGVGPTEYRARFRPALDRVA